MSTQCLCILKNARTSIFNIIVAWSYIDAMYSTQQLTENLVSEMRYIICGMGGCEKISRNHQWWQQYGTEKLPSWSALVSVGSPVNL